MNLTPELLGLFSNIKALLDHDTDIWKLCLDIIDTYIVLDANLLFQVSSFFFISSILLENKFLFFKVLLRFYNSKVL